MIKWNDPKSKISKYFTVNDVTKGDPTRIPPDRKTRSNAKKLAAKLDKLVEQFGPLQINSWYRDPISNRRVGGAPNSQHLQGWAVDCVLKNGTQNQKRVFEKWCDVNWKGGVGRGMSTKGFVHLDLGPNRRWDY